MDKIKNYAIAILTGLLALSLFTQPAQSAGKTIQAKQMEYLMCLQGIDFDAKANGLYLNALQMLKYTIPKCATFRP
jgi:hypothetical protein